MNIVKMYDIYRNQQIKEFRENLEGITKEILLVTEKIPKKIVLNSFKTNPSRKNIFFNDEINKRSKKRCLHVCLEDANFEKNYPCDTTVEEKFDMFLTEYYPGITNTGDYILDLDKKTIRFHFSFKSKLEDDDFNICGKCVSLKPGRDDKILIPSIYLFNDDVTALLGDKFDWDNWYTTKYLVNKAEEPIETPYCYSGSTGFEFPIV